MSGNDDRRWHLVLHVVTLVVCVFPYSATTFVRAIDSYGSTGAARGSISWQLTELRNRGRSEKCCWATQEPPGQAMNMNASWSRGDFCCRKLKRKVPERQSFESAYCILGKEIHSNYSNTLDLLVSSNWNITVIFR
jgi:hypothetical protein